MKRLTISFAAASLLVAGLGPAVLAVPSSGATPPPTPPPLNAATPVPSPSASPSEMPGVQGLFPSTGGAHASPSPPVPTRVGIEGVWELAIQRGADTSYTHLKLKQQQNALIGTYLDTSNKPFPAVGTVDGNNVRIVVSLADGSTIVFEGHLDGTTDMIGMMTTAHEQVPFSADYRPKESFFDNINEQPSGIGNTMPSPPPR
ncbi:MAG TPA: hypothetical protein VIN40_00255 [Candidatus Tyrphobacter sp.]